MEVPGLRNCRWQSVGDNAWMYGWALNPPVRYSKQTTIFISDIKWCLQCETLPYNFWVIHVFLYAKCFAFLWYNTHHMYYIHDEYCRLINCFVSWTTQRGLVLVNVLCHFLNILDIVSLSDVKFLRNAFDIQDDDRAQVCSACYSSALWQFLYKTE